MKKIFIFFIIVLFSSLVIAQTTYTLGPKAGINFSRITTDENNFSPKSKFGYQGGGFVRILFDPVYLQTELLYIHMRGSLINPHDPQYFSKKSNYTVTIDNVEIPLLAGCKIYSTEEFSVRANLGPIFSLTLSNNLVLEIEGVEEESKYYSKDDLKKGFRAFNIGAGVDYKAFTCDLRCDIGLSKISKEFLFKKLNTFSFTLGMKIFEM